MMRYRMTTLISSAAVAAGLLIATANGASAYEPPASWYCGVGQPYPHSPSGWSTCNAIPSGHYQRVELWCQDQFTGATRNVYGPYISQNYTKSEATCNQREWLFMIGEDGK
jgi:hypothetical protein